ncbi:hypothetical protein D3C81_1125740 [compost metagenome]
MMSASRMPPSTSARISALVALPSLIHDSVALPGPTPEACCHLPTYSEPLERSRAWSAMNMNRPPLVASSPISTVRSSGMTCTSSCEMRPRQ